MIVERDSYVDRLLRSRGNGLVKIVTGMRRSGKSFLLKNLFRQRLLDQGVPESRILAIDMESRKNRQYRDPDLLLSHIEGLMVDEGPYYVIIDEVQEVRDFASMLSSLLLMEATDVYVTGSNSRFLSSDIATEFRGRGEEIHVWPLSFGEFMTAYLGTKEEGLAEYMMFGGLPQLLTQEGDDRKADYLQGLYRTVYLRDIYERNRVSLQGEFEELSRAVASTVGSPLNAATMANTFKSVSHVRDISDKTVGTYISHMQDAFLIEKAHRYDIKGRKYIGSQYKCYYQDLGLRNAVLSFRQSDPSHLMENLIYNEMRRRGWMVDVGNISTRLRDANGRQQRVTVEVDFVCNKGSRRLYIQSAWRIPDSEKMEQEKRSLRLVGDSFGKMLIVGEHAKPWADADGIQTLSLYDFLLTSDADY